MSNEDYLVTLGIKDERLQRIAIESIPCGEETVKAAMDDSTDVQVNSVRALMMCNYKGMIKGLKLAERAFNPPRT